MTSGKEIANDLLRRLLAGERGSLPMQLAMLLEKSSALRNSDYHYREILPPQLAEVQLSSETTEMIITALCGEISRNPDSALIAAVSTTGARDVTRTVAEIFINPPRQMTMDAYGQALGILYSYLPACLARDPEFLTKEQLTHLVRLLKSFQTADDITVRRHTTLLLEQLEKEGLGAS